MSKYFGEEIFKLGFGLMRLPHNEDGTNDMPQICDMVDEFIKAGGTYFDTAYVYDDGLSEDACKKAVVERYPRESFTIATKMNARVAKDEQDAKSQLQTSLDRLGTDYIDFYLLHALSDRNYQSYDEFHLWDFIEEKKAEGVLKNIGFSFHGSPELLDKLLDEHKVDFIQLQLNYADWENDKVWSRKNYEVARKHGVSIVVMEPVKGGSLANPHESVTKIFKEANPELSVPSWAIRYVASLDGIITVLSGMSTIDQMKDNVSYMKDFKPLDESEQQVIKNVQEALEKIPSIPCTSCHYCTEGCPMNIPIPEIFGAMNKDIMYNLTDKAVRDYKKAVEEKGRASECIECGQCEAACPQSIEIINWLKKCAEKLEA